MHNGLCQIDWNILNKKNQTIFDTKMLKLFYLISSDKNNSQLAKSFNTPILYTTYILLKYFYQACFICSELEFDKISFIWLWKELFHHCLKFFVSNMVLINGCFPTVIYHGQNFECLNFHYLVFKTIIFTLYWYANDDSGWHLYKTNNIFLLIVFKESVHLVPAPHRAQNLIFSTFTICHYINYFTIHI